MTSIQKEKYWQGYGEIETLVDCSWECEMVVATMENNVAGLQKDEPAVLLLGIYTKELKAGSQKFVQPKRLLTDE